MKDIGIIDERRQWLRERYEMIVPIIMRRSEQVKVIVDGKECSACLARTTVAMAGEQIKVRGNTSAFHQT